VTIDVTVNGIQYRRDVEPRLLLSDFLRQDLGLTGTHVGCEHGVKASRPPPTSSTRCKPPSAKRTRCSAASAPPASS